MSLTGFDLAQALIVGGLTGSGAIVARDAASAAWWRARESLERRAVRRLDQELRQLIREETK